MGESDLKIIITLFGILLLVPTAAFSENKPSAEKKEISGNVPEFGATASELPANARVEDIVEPSADYHYAGFGKPDPFQPPLSVRAIVHDAVEIPIVSPLQRYGLKDLRLVGVWARTNGVRKALVLTPTMEGIIIKVGDLVGSGGGKVMAIGDSTVVVREFLIANDGTRQFSDVRLVFTEKPAVGVPDRSKGVIVIAPGAARPELQLQGASAAPPSNINGVAPVMNIAVPGNQIPANAASQGRAPDAGAPIPGSEALPATNGGTGQSGSVPSTNGTSGPVPKKQGNGSSYSF